MRSSVLKYSKKRIKTLKKKQIKIYYLNLFKTNYYFINSNYENKLKLKTPMTNCNTNI